MRTVKLEIDVEDGDFSAALELFRAVARQFDDSTEPPTIADVANDQVGHVVRAVLTMATRGDLLTGDEPNMRTWTYGGGR